MMNIKELIQLEKDLYMRYKNQCKQLSDSISPTIINKLINDEIKLKDISLAGMSYREKIEKVNTSRNRWKEVIEIINKEQSTETKQD